MEEVSTLLYSEFNNYCSKWFIRENLGYALFFNMRTVCNDNYSMKS